MGEILKDIRGLVRWITSLFIRETAIIEEPMEPKMTKAEELYQIARAYVGHDASWRNVAPKELACAESVSSTIQHLYEDFPTEVSTIRLNKLLEGDGRFEYTTDWKPGTIIISPTDGQSIGHTGIFGKDNAIMSNTSITGIWEKNYTLDSWIRRYRSKLGLKILFYTPVDTVQT